VFAISSRLALDVTDADIEFLGTPRTSPSTSIAQLPKPVDPLSPRPIPESTMPGRRVRKSESRGLTIWSREYLGRGSGSNLQPLFRSLLDAICAEIPNCGAGLYLRKRGHLVLIISSDQGRVLRYRKTLALTQLLGLLVNEVSYTPHLAARDFFATGKPDQLVAFSLNLGKRPIGMLLLCSTNLARIPARKMVQIRPTLINLATTLSMVDALARERERSSRLGLINKLCQQVDSMVGESNLYDRIVSLIQEKFGYDHVGLYLVDKKSTSLILQSLAGKYKGITPLGQRIPFGQGIVSWVATHGRTLLSNDVRENPYFLNLTPDLIPTQAELCVPIRMDDEIIGVLNVEHSELLSFDEDDINAVEVLTGRIAVAIKKSRLYDELNHSHARLEAIVSSIGQGLMIINPQFRVEWMNSTLERWVQGNRVGECCFELFGRSEESCRNCPSQRTFETGRGYQETIKAAGEKYYNIISAPIVNGEGRVVQALELIEDVTDQLAARGVLEHLKQELERSQRLASIGEVTASIVHEVRNPLNALSQAADLLEGDLGLTDEQRELMGVVKEETGRLNDIVTAYLSLANGKHREFATTDLRAIVEKVVTLLSVDQTFSRRAKITVDIPTDLPPVYCDSNAIRQVFWNLLLNSVESMERPGNIIIRARYDASLCAVTVSDDGRGIAEEELGRIFDPFYSTKGRGTGLGLAIVRRIIEDHGWRITMSSKKGEGTRFTIVINHQDQ
jgi:signal transduction histidine kinase/putative methionine-R-sulfoxide reductase with GAF domain